MVRLDRRGVIVGGVFSRQGMLQGWFAAVMVLIMFSGVWGYFTLFEALNGPNAGEAATGDPRRHGHGTVDHARRGADSQSGRILDCYFPIPFAPALVTMFLHPSNKRPGTWRRARSSCVTAPPTGCLAPRRRANQQPTRLRPAHLSCPKTSSGCWIAFSRV